MQQRPDQFLARLEREPLAPVYLLAGEEPLTLTELSDALRARARVSGITERMVLTVDAAFSWQSLEEVGASLSLFADRRLIELRLDDAKPGNEGAEAIQRYCARPDSPDVLMVLAGKLDRRAQQAKWFKAIDQTGVVVLARPVDPASLPAWIEKRLSARGLRIAPDAAALLADRVEGNLLACAQEIEMLSLMVAGRRVEIEDVLAAVGDSARFELFSLADTALLGDAARAVRMLRGLQAEGVEPVLITWALTRELRVLARLAEATARGLSPGEAMSRAGIWRTREPAFRSALKRLRPGDAHGLLRQAFRIDRIIKGAERGSSAWEELVWLILDMAGAHWLRAA